MTFDQYIQNPMGVKNAVLGSREMYRNMYGMKLDAIMVREMGKIDYHLYKSKDRYYAYIKVPSEKIDKFYYDVIIEFYPGKDTKTSAKSLINYEIRVFSNDPAFVFTFAHAFIKNKMFITEYADKMSREAIKTKAKERNPMDTVGYVKSLFFAYLIMKRRNLFEKVLYSDKYDEKNVKRMIMPADQKIALRQASGEDISNKEKRARAVAARKTRQEEERIPKERRTVSSTMSNKIRTTTMTSRSNKNVKTTKIVGRKKR